MAISTITGVRWETSIRTQGNPEQSFIHRVHLFHALLRILHRPPFQLSQLHPLSRQAELRVLRSRHLFPFHE